MLGKTLVIVNPAARHGVTASLVPVVTGLLDGQVDYDLVITEFDVKDKALPADIAIRDAAVADFTKRYFEIMLEYEQLGDILAWGMVDPFSWLQGFAPRDDGLEVRCCPYDADYRAKPLRTALAEVFAQAAS